MARPNSEIGFEPQILGARAPARRFSPRIVDVPEREPGPEALEFFKKVGQQLPLSRTKLP